MTLFRYFSLSGNVMKLAMNKELIVTLLVLGVVWGEVQSCISCGSECESACGTRHFRTCCFNYLRKRSQPEAFISPAMDPSLRLELWLAKERNSILQRESDLSSPLISNRNRFANTEKP